MWTFLVWSQFLLLFSVVYSEDIHIVTPKLIEIEPPTRNETNCDYAQHGLPGFSCNDGGKCILPHAVCNGIKDCARGEDESNCAQYCHPGYTRCTADLLCIPAVRNCDGMRDCPDGSDEKYCVPETKFLSIPWFWIGLAVLFLVCILVLVAVGKSCCTKKNNRRRRPPPRSSQPVRTINTSKNSRLPNTNNVTTVLVREDETGTHRS